eukprot:495308_1
MANESVSRSDLHEFHKQQILQNENNDHNTLKIIKAFGDIDNLLDRLLKEKSIDIAQDELNSIHKIITNQPQSVSKFQSSIESTKINADVDIYNQKEESEKSVLILHENNTYLNSYFGQTNANKILNAIHHKITRSLLIILLSIWMIWSFSTTKINVCYCIYLILSSIYYIIYSSFYALSINKNVFGKIVKTMDFWIQTYYVIVAMVCLGWYRLDTEVQTDAKNIYISARLLFAIATLFAVLIIVSFDGYQGIRKYKIFFSGFCGIICIFQSIFYQFTSYSNGDDSIVYIYNDIGFSRIAQFTNGFQILCIFMFKQCILTYY